MKKTMICFFVLIVLLSTLVTAQDEKFIPVVVVDTFDIASADGTGDADKITDIFITELVDTGKVNVVDAENFKRIKEGVIFQSSDWSDSAKTSVLGKSVDASMIVRGQILNLESAMYLSISIIDVKTATVIFSGREQFHYIENSEYVNKIADAIYAHFFQGFKKNLMVGDRGQGGGLVFYRKGNIYYECGEARSFSMLGPVGECREYRGGGYSDWYMPSIEELQWIYTKLKKTGIISYTDVFCSSSKDKYNKTLYMNFNDGTIFPGNRPASVIPIRTF